MRIRKLFACTAIALSLAACSDPKAANKGNFEAALNAYFQDTGGPACSWFMGSSSFPVTLFDSKDYYQPEVTAERAKQIRALAAAGLLTPSATTKEYPDPSYSPNAPSRQQLPATRYELNDTGKPYFQFQVANLSWLCFGKPKIVSVDRFTEPADLKGYHISRVTYRYRIEAADWAKNPAVKQAFPEIAKRLDGEQTQIDTLILTSDGWRREQQDF